MLRRLCPLIAVCLTACATPLTLISPPVPDSLLVRCPDAVSDPLTTADQFDTARALAQATGSYRRCQARQAALVDAIEAREAILSSIRSQIEASR